MQIMHEKGLVSRNETAKTHIYTPVFAKEKAQEQYISKMIKTLFSGNSAQLVMQALGSHQSSQEELAEIKSLIESIEKRK
jgi:predicted transcriptional regulator